MKKLLLSSVALVGFISAAAAADLPARTMAPAPAPMLAVPVFTWTGFYAGIHGGYISQESTAGVVGLSGPGTFPFAAGVASFGGTGSRGIDSDGFMFGGQVGGNVQFGMFVVGLEADISYTDIGERTSVTTLAGAPGVFLPGTTTFQSDMEYFGTVRGRLGLAFDRVMIYGTGGLAYGGLENRATFVGTAAPNPTLSGTSDDDDDTQIGYTIGGGVEFAITNNLTLKGEYLYYEFDRRNVRAVGVGGGAIAADFIDVRVEDEGHIGRVGLNFKF